MSNLIRRTKSHRMKEVCKYKRCFYMKGVLDDKGGFKQYDYLCNFNAEKSFFNDNKNKIYCSYFSIKGNSDENMFKELYINKCDKYINYYLCSTQEKKHDLFDLKNNLKCPTKFKKYRIIILGILFPLIDIGADFILILFVYCQYTFIIKLINFENIFQGRRLSPSSLNSTKDCSIIIDNNNNRNILQQINVRQTEIYISQNLVNYLNEKNKRKINNDKIELELIKDNNKKNIKGELSDSKNELLNIKKNIFINKPQNNTKK